MSQCRGEGSCWSWGCGDPCMAGLGDLQMNTFAEVQVEITSGPLVNRPTHMTENITFP